MLNDKNVEVSRTLYYDPDEGTRMIRRGIALIASLP